MYYENAYYDVINDFIAIYNVIEMVPSSMLYIINDVIMSSNIQCNKFSRYLFLIMNLIYSAKIQDINENYLLKIGQVITFCNGHIYYGSPCITVKIQYNNTQT